MSVASLVQEADPGIGESLSTDVSELAAHQQGKPSRLVCGCPRASLNGVDMDPMERRPMAHDQSPPCVRLHRQGGHVLHFGTHQTLLDALRQQLALVVQDPHMFNMVEQRLVLNTHELGLTIAGSGPQGGWSGWRKELVCGVGASVLQPCGARRVHDPRRMSVTCCTAALMCGYRARMACPSAIWLSPLPSQGALGSHAACPERISGKPIDHWIIVPSTENRPGPHPLRELVGIFRSEAELASHDVAGVVPSVSGSSATLSAHH